MEEIRAEWALTGEERDDRVCYEDVYEDGKTGLVKRVG